MQDFTNSRNWDKVNMKRDIKQVLSGILMFRAWFDDVYNAKARSVYEEARKR